MTRNLTVGTVLEARPKPSKDEKMRALLRVGDGAPEVQEGRREEVIEHPIET
jgi:hypothetical protein